MDELITTGTTKELVVPSRTEMSRRDVLKRFGAGGLAVASAAVLSPLGAEAAYSASLIDLVLGIDKSGANALIKVSYTLGLSQGAYADIKSGQHRYGIWFRLFNGNDKLVREWSSGPLPAKTVYYHGTSQTMAWSALRSYGTTFYAKAYVYRILAGRRSRVSATNFTLDVHL